MPTLSAFQRILIAWATAVPCMLGGYRLQAEQWDDFERHIRPLLSERCYGCHSSTARTVHGGLKLDSAEALARGGDSGPVIDAKTPLASPLLQAIRHENGLEMPPQGKLPEREIEVLTEWVVQGAAFPPGAVDSPSRSGSIDYESSREFWSWQPLRPQPLPAVGDAAWSRNRIDQFVWAAMHEQGLQPTPPADRRTLMRRLSFDLTGLPPSPEQVRRFLDDPSPDAYERLVDSLLASPRYGEHWARWWLDLARYADRTASWIENPGQPYLYRDWVVRSLNDDLPYDAFVRRQLAADLMDDTGPEEVAALGFVSLSPDYWKELKLPAEMIKTIVADELEERVDAVSRTFLGLTVACARCHDHKFDPISTHDYYALAGVFASCRQVELPLVSAEEYEPVRLAKLAVKITADEIEQLEELKPPPRFRIEELKQTIDRLKQSTPGYDQPLAAGLAEESLFVERAGYLPEEGTRLDYRPGPRDLPVHIRGNPNRPGPVVPRRFLRVLDAEAEPYRQGSGRLELAESMLTEAQALTARVIVNRVWLAHFGRGIVTTPSNFGQQGSPPSHPELLDDLAWRFVADGWSLKRLHREIVLSATWQQASQLDDPRRDPDNQWLARMSRRRLTFEQWRDAMLLASDVLDSRLGGPSTGLEDDVPNHRRTLYATVDRHDVSPAIMLHDVPDPQQHSPQRVVTATPLQGLYALNGSLLMEQAQELAQLGARVSPEPTERIDAIYWRLFSRSPSARELQLGLAYVERDAADASDLWLQYVHALLAANEFLFID